MVEKNSYTPEKETWTPDIDREVTISSSTRSAVPNPSSASSILPDLVHVSAKGCMLDSDDRYLLVFPLTEGIEIHEFPHDLPKTNGDEVLFIPSFHRIRMRHKSSEGQALVFRFFASIQLCEGKRCPDVSSDASTGKDDKQSKTYIHTTTLKANDAVRLWRDSVVCYLKKGMKLQGLYEHKLRELFSIFWNLYPKSEIEPFFSEFHCHHTGFRSFVFHHFMDARNVEELAELSGLSLSSFKRTFKEEFHQSPLQWVHRQKAYFLYYDLVETDSPLTELADRYKLSSVSYLCAFCKKMLGDTPYAIRNNAPRIDV